jgi:hypothetical protein
VNEDHDGRQTASTQPGQSEEFGLPPSNFLGRQWKSVKRLHGWRRPAGLVAIGTEVLLLGAALVVLLII